MRTVRCLIGIVAAGGIVCLTGLNCRAEDALKKGAWALQFEVNGDFDLAAFQGSTISLKKHTGDGTAWRMGLDIALSDQATHTQNDSYTNPGFPGYPQLTQSVNVGDQKQQGLTLTIQRVCYTHRGGPVKFFYGYGPLVSYTHSTNDATTTANNFRIIEGTEPDTILTGWIARRQVGSANAWSVGARGVIGVEWFASSSISLLAEYGTNLKYDWNRAEAATSRRTNTDPEPQEESVSVSKKEGFNLGSGAVKFGLSAYF